MFGIFINFVVSKLSLKKLNHSINYINMIKEEVKALLEEYLDAPEAWSDNVMIEVDPQTLDCRLYDEDDADIEASDKDYWEVMDLLSMSVDDPGRWEIDRDALDELAASYQYQ